jgi:hypothetical protein
MENTTKFIIGVGIIFFGISIYSMLLAFQKPSANFAAIGLLSLVIFGICLGYLLLSAHQYIDKFAKRFTDEEIGRTFAEYPLAVKRAEVYNFWKFKRVVLKSDKEGLFKLKDFTDQFMTYLHFKDFHS